MSTRSGVKTVTIGLIQTKAESEPQANVQKAVRKVREAAQSGAQIVLLPELFRTLYFPQTRQTQFFELAEPIPGPTTELFRDLARELGLVVIVPVFERSASGLYHNAAVVFDADGALLGIYRKMHIPNDPGYFEKHYFAPGDLGFKSFNTRYGKLAVMICWDQWFPEAARIAALEGPWILFYPTAIGWHSTQGKANRLRECEAWELIQRSHGISNGVFVASANRVGREGDLTFWGKSFVSGPFGEVLASASDHREEVLVTACDLTEILRVRSEWPFLRARRIDAYGPILSELDSAKHTSCGGRHD